ncbi:MAG: prepilin-type N-terminal cleavage/methylation domain-containing protein [Deltaproteobacteria bacterium]|nr:prepilin-type N-terminal cleavage/methylation domain-containing protein [Deltaproteobacteria bacterium]
MRSSDAGFTLFEVLGAVAILAILYTTLSTVAIQGLRSEGESRRILEASLLADWELSEFELSLETGEAPVMGITEGQEVDDMTVTWEVAPLQTAIFESNSDEDRRAGAQNYTAPGTQLPAAQAAATKDGVVVFLRVDLTVSWLEAGNVRSVKRTIFAVDEDAAAKFAQENARSTSEGERP